MKKSQFFALVVVVAIVGMAGAVVGYRLEDRDNDKYHEGVAFLDGSGAYPSAIGMATFEARPKESIFKLQLQGVPELANTALDIAIRTTLADGIKIGTLKIDGKGKGNITIKVKAGQTFPEIADGSEVALKTAVGKTVAEGFFGAP